MSGTKLLLDTNIVLYLLNGDQTIAELIHEKQLYISFVTELELLSYSRLSDEDQSQIRSFVNECRVINITEQIKKQTIEIRREHKVKLPDSIIAATSKYLDVPLITSDQGFKKISQIDVLIYESQNVE